MADHVANSNVSARVDATSIDLAAHAARLHAAFVQAITEDDIRVITRKLVEQAREGDRTSARLVLKYGLGAMLDNAKRAASGLTTMSEAEFAANAGKFLRELDKMEAAQRRQANFAGGPRPGGPTPGTAPR